MKKDKILLVLICLLLTTNVSAASNPYPQYFNGQTNCTWYAWKMAYEKGGVALPGWGNANTWYESAKNAGYSVGTTPQANSIAIWTKCDGDCGTYGHVGYVERVSADGQTLYIKDTSYGGMNGCPNTEDETYKECIRNGVSEETDRICLENAPRITCGFAKDMNSQGVYTGDITEFIYLNNTPQTPVIDSKPSNDNSNQNKEEKPKEEAKKSNNTNLKEIKLNVLEIKFSNEITDYNIEVENNTDIIEINAIPEHEKATIEGIGEHNLQIGKNLIELAVTAEDGTKKIYNLNITRKEKTEEEIPDILEKQEINTKNNNYLFIILIALAVVVIISIGFVIKFKHKSKKC